MDTYILYGLAGAGLLASLVKDRKKTMQALKKAWKAFEGIMPQFLVVLVFVSVSLALLNTAFISQVLGADSGILGVIAAALVGAITLIPGFVAFPAVAALLKEGAGVPQAAAFVSSLMMVGVVTMPMEMKYFGKRATLARNALAFFFSFAVAAFVSWAVAL